MAVRCAFMIALVALCLPFTAAESASLQKLRQLSSEANHGVVRFAQGNYSRYTVTKDPDYTVVVFFTASEAKYGCQLCGLAAREVVMASRSYGNHHGVHFNGSSAQAQIPKDDQRTVFFAVVDFKFNPEAFQLHGFTSVPHVVVFSKGSANLGSNAQHNQRLTPTMPRIDIPKSMFVQPKEGFVTAQGILAAIGEGQVRIVRAAGERQPLAVLITAGLTLLCVIISYNIENIRFYRQKWFWTASSLLAYGISISGVISCVIKTPPWFGMGANGKPVVFSEDSGEQYVLEGLVVGAINLVAAGAVIGLVYVSKSGARSWLVKSLLSCVFIAVFAVAYWHIISLYSIKTKWYRVESIVPGEIQKPIKTVSQPVAKWVTKTALPKMWQYYEMAAALLPNVTAIIPAATK